ncbi:MAG: hypothetical protein ACYDBZ_04445, partial [Steroidobacteraceae bacterium]
PNRDVAHGNFIHQCDGRLDAEPAANEMHRLRQYRPRGNQPFFPRIVQNFSECWVCRRRRAIIGRGRRARPRLSLSLAGLKASVSRGETG